MLAALFCGIAMAQNPPISAIGRDTPQDNTPHVQAVTPQAGAPAPVNASTYKVEPGDILKIEVWKVPEMSCLQCTVQEDGKITMPLINELAIGEKTPDQIQQIVTEAAAKYVKNPLITVTVLQVLSKRYYIDGMASRPGEYALTQPTTVFEALSRAGGVQEFANQKKIYVLRGDKRLPFNYKEVIHGKHLEQNIKLEPGDHIVVP